jgi:hypothetical protein
MTNDLIELIGKLLPILTLAAGPALGMIFIFVFVDAVKRITR